MLYGVNDESFCFIKGIITLFGITMYPSSPAEAFIKSGIMEIVSVRASIESRGIFKTALPFSKFRDFSELFTVPSLYFVIISTRSAALAKAHAIIVKIAIILFIIFV